MKKYIQLFVVIVLVLTVIGVARNGAAWASAIPGSQRSTSVSDNGIVNLLQSGPVTVTASGSYNVEGVCTFDVEYKGTGLQDKADARISINESKKVPFSGVGTEKLIFPGCHIVHYKTDQIIREASTEDGSWKVCFGTNPALQIKIYYYLDDPANGSKIWIPLKTTVDANGEACAPALFTGVYMPAGQRINPPGAGDEGNILNPPPAPGGSVKPPPAEIVVRGSGTYAVGGICAMIIEYKISGLMDQIHVQHPTEANDIVPFPDDGGLLYLPGCHVAHYRDAKVKQVMTAEEGRWEICFAARPDKDMTIYFYQDDLSTVTPPWQPLETTIRGGLACAPLADYSGVYAPAGQ